MPEEQLSPMPEWEEFRSQKRGESRTDYVYELLKAAIKQTRDRDHWVANQLHVMFGNQELLREELMGEGTVFRQPGILRVLKSNQERMPELVKQAIRDTQTDELAHSYSTLKKWMWGVLGGSVVAIVTAVVYVIVGGHP